MGIAMKRSKFHPFVVHPIPANWTRIKTKYAYYITERGDPRTRMYARNEEEIRFLIKGVRLNRKPHEARTDLF